MSLNRIGREGERTAFEAFQAATMRKDMYL